jgi:hypothetical protein
MTRSPRRLREQVKDTVSELPIHAARLAVMGVGRALLLTDRVRKDYREARQSGLGPVLGRLKDDAEAITGMVVGKVAGNGKGKGGQEETKARAADSEISVGKPKPTPQRPATPTTRPSAAKPTTPKPASKPVSKPAEKPVPKPDHKPVQKPDERPAEEPAVSKAAPAKPTPKPKTSAAEPATGLPLAGYEEASLASVRARLRSLDAKQVAELRDYERAHAARADFLRMYENRINKLRGEP